MNKRQLEVQKATLKNEQKVLDQLKVNYEESLQDIQEKIKLLQANPLTQSKIYQLEYQKALEIQVSSILDKMKTNSFTTISEYMQTCYEDGFFGTLYDLQGQGIPLIFPFDQEQVVKVLQLSPDDLKLSDRLYENVDQFKKNVQSEIARGISSGQTFAQIATSLKLYGSTSIGRAMTIARTEGHRVQQTAALDCQKKAKEKGADIVKQWDSTLDNHTRKSHQLLDGQTREIDKPFEVNGHKAMHPGGFGIAGEDINCRCCLLQRARWALDDEEFTKMNGDTGELVKLKEKEYNQFKDTAKTEIQKQEIISNNPILKGFIETLEKLGVQYNQVKVHTTALSESKIIQTLAGGDKTKGSCASVGLAYIGQKSGLDVIDFRGGESQNFFSTAFNLKKIAEFPNVTKISETARATATAGKKLLTKVKEGNEYYFVCGRHASIVRKNEGVLQYLELQSADRSDWTNFNGNTRYTLSNRFGATQTGANYEAYMFNINDVKDSKDLQILLGYINTSVDKQKKGVHGGIK